MLVLDTQQCDPVIHIYWASQMGQTIKNPPVNAGDPGLIPRLGRSPGERKGNLLQYSCLENPIVGGAWQATVLGVAELGMTD